ncbi:MAG: AI-2E family transporter [Anaerolineae bacterium]|nr:AI-2E family transporter [Anaerolineae bacterium]
MQETVKTTNGQIARWVLITLIALLVFAAVWLIRDIVMLTLTAVIFAILINAPMRFFVRLGVNRPVSLILTIILIIALIGLLITVVLPPLLEQVATLVRDTIPNAITRLQNEINAEDLANRFTFLKGWIDQDNFNLQSTLQEFSTQFVERIAALPGQIFPFVGSVFSSILSILIVLFLALYFSAEPHVHTEGLIRLVPLSYRDRARDIMAKLYISLKEYLKAQLLLMLMIGVSTGIALALMGVPLSTALGTITGVFSFVPNFGPLVAIVPILAVAIINTPDKILLIIVVYYILQFIQSQIVTPLLLGQGVNMPPALILLAQIIAGIFFGFMGLLLAVPLAAIFMILIREVYVRDVLGDTSVDAAEVTAPRFRATVAASLASRGRTKAGLPSATPQPQPEGGDAGTRQ